MLERLLRVAELVGDAAQVVAVVGIPRVVADGCEELLTCGFVSPGLRVQNTEVVADQADVGIVERRRVSEGAGCFFSTSLSIVELRQSFVCRGDRGGQGDFIQPESLFVVPLSVPMHGSPHAQDE